MELVVRPHILSDKNMQVLAVEAGCTLQELFDAVELPDAYRDGACILVSGQLVERQYWPYVRPKAHTHVLIASMLHGGRGRSKQILAMVAMIALSVYAGPIAGWLTNSAVGTTAFTVAKIGVMVVGSLAINALFAPPKVNNFKSSEYGKDVYTFSGQSNQSRPYGSLLRVYGRHRVAPDLAAVPYTVNVGDDVFFIALYSFGYGPLQLEDFKIGANPIAGYAEPPEIVVHESFVAGTPLKLYTNDVWQDAYSLDLVKAAPVVVTTKPATEWAVVDIVFPQGLGYYNSNGGADTRSTVMRIEYAPQGSSSWVQVPSAGGNEVQLSHGYVGGFEDFTHNVPSYGYGVEYQYGGVYGLQAGTTALSGITWSKGTPAVGSKIMLGPYTCTLTAVSANSCTFTPALPGLVTFYDAVGTSRYYSAATTRDWTVSEAKLGGFVAGVTLQFPSAGTWRIRFTKIDNDYTDTRELWKRYVSAVRSFKSVAPIAPDLPTTVVEVRMKASGQLNGSIEQFSAIATSKLRSWNGSSFVAAAPTRNPAWVYLDLLTGVANTRPIPTSRIDLAQLKAWADYCDAVKSGFTGPNATMDVVIGEPRTLWEIMQSVAAVGRATPTMRDNKYSVILDSDTRTPVQVFTPRNSWDLNSSRSYLTQPHGLRLKWIDPAVEYVPAEIVVYSPGYSASNATVFEEVSTFGMTRPEQVTRYGRYLLAQARLRAEQFTLEADIENLVATRGDMVLVQHDVLQVGGASARVQSISGQNVTIDAPMMQFAAPLGVLIRRNTGTATPVLAATIVDETTFAVTGSLSGCAAGDLVVYGTSNSVTGQYVLKGISPTRDLSATLTFEEYAPGVLTAEDGTIPPYVPQGGSTASTPPVEGLAGVVNTYYEREFPYGLVRLQWRQPSGVAVPSGYTIYRIDSAGLVEYADIVSSQSYDDPTLYELWKVPAGVNQTYGVAPQWPGGVSGKMATVTVAIPYIALAGPANYDTFSMVAQPDGTRQFIFAFTTTPVPIGLAGAEIRYTPGNVGSPDWNTMSKLSADGFFSSSPAEINQLAAGQYTFALRAKNVSGAYSSTQRIVVATIPERRMTPTYTYNDGAALWNVGGAVTSSTSIDAATGQLEAKDAATWLTPPQWASWTYWSSSPANSIGYQSPSRDLLTVTSGIASVAVSALGDVVTRMRTAVTAGAWGAWGPVGAFAGIQYIQFDISVTKNASERVATIKSFQYNVFINTVHEYLDDLVLANIPTNYRLGVGDVRVPLAGKYGVIITADAVIQDSRTGQWTMQRVDKQLTGPRFIFQLDGVNTDPQLVDFEIEGY